MLQRRLITVPGFVLAWILWLAAAPLWLPLAIAADLVRRDRGVVLRSATLVSVYLSCEIVGLIVAGALSVWKAFCRPDARRFTGIHFRLEACWGTTLFRAVVRLFGLRIEVEGDADLGRGPYLLLLRHASTADTLLASALVSTPYGVRLRYVLKRELLWDPCLDIVGHRVPNVFVDRASADSMSEIARVQELARDLGPRDGILIYPEGTRFSEAKRSRAIDRIEEKGDASLLEYARSLTHVMPPRHNGTLGLLAAAPTADVVLCAHTGFEGAASFAEIWKGALVGKVIRIQFRRIPRNLLPCGRDARIAWIREEWRRIDAWIGRQRMLAS